MIIHYIFLNNKLHVVFQIIDVVLLKMINSLFYFMIFEHWKQ